MTIPPDARRPSAAPAAPAGGEALRTMLDAFEADETLIPETSRAIRDALPGYDEVPEDSMEASIRRNLDLSIRTIRFGRAPDPQQIDEAEELALERMEQGVPLGSVLAYGHLIRGEEWFGQPAVERRIAQWTQWLAPDASAADEGVLRIGRATAVTATVAWLPLDTTEPERARYSLAGP